MAKRYCGGGYFSAMRRRRRRDGRPLPSRRVVVAYMQEADGTQRQTSYVIRGRGLRAAEGMARRWLRGQG